MTNQVATIKHACNVIQKELPKIIESEEFLSVIEEFSKSEHSLEEFYTHLQKEEISQDKSYIYQELLGLSDTTLTHCYSLGKNLFEKRKFKDSESIFHFLMLLNPYVTSFWVCAGLSSIMLNDIQEAAHLFHEAKSLHSTQPNIYFYAACCDFLLNNYSSALQELNQAEKLLKLTPDNSTLFPMIERLRYLTVGKKHAI